MTSEKKPSVMIVGARKENTPPEPAISSERLEKIKKNVKSFTYERPSKV